jgi:hypothetical protein
VKQLEQGNTINQFHGRVHGIIVQMRISVDAGTSSPFD